MKRVIIALDLYTGSKKPDYRKLDLLMKNMGFHVVSPLKGIDLPHNTYIGKFRDSVSVAKIRQELWANLGQQGLQPKALIGGELKNWSMIRSNRPTSHD